jgi:hypothetical protein
MHYVSDVDDCVLTLWEWTDWVDQLPEMDKKTHAKRQKNGYYLVVLEDSTIMFDRDDWDAVFEP